MEALFNLTYKDEVEVIKDELDFEMIGDQRYINHVDEEARLYWAFCRPSGSHPDQIKDSSPLVSIMAFNHSRLGALKRFSLLHDDVINDPSLRIRIKNRTRMLFRALIDQDFSELNLVLDLVPVFLDVAVDQLKHARKWNDIQADPIEATKFLKRAQAFVNASFLEALYLKLNDFSDQDSDEIVTFLETIALKKGHVDQRVLAFYQKKATVWVEESDLHLLQKKRIEKLANALV
jgi:hypothetical protein